METRLPSSLDILEEEERIHGPLLENGETLSLEQSPSTQDFVLRRPNGEMLFGNYPKHQPIPYPDSTDHLMIKKLGEGFQADA